jgi:IS30 family transposase
MKKAHDLSRAERLEIGILLGRGYSLRSIARALCRSPNTLSYEVRKNSTRGAYVPLKAHAKARLRKRMRRLMFSKIEGCPTLKRFVIETLAAHWNPDEIAGYLKRRRTQYPWYASKTAIYEWLRTARGERYCVHLYSQRKRVKRQKGKRTGRVMIPHRVDIARRFKGADHRTRFGHFEGDTLLGRRGTPGGVKVGYERKARLVLARKVENMRPRHHAEAERSMYGAVAAQSITRDNGLENKNHKQVGIPSFFCRPYASWQKGGVENANKMVRRYFPKGTDFRSVSQAEIDRVVSIINRKPRKILGYRSALEVARRAGIIKSESVLIQG